jgi:hypothetical protein
LRRFSDHRSWPSFVGSAPSSTPYSAKALTSTSMWALVISIALMSSPVRRALVFGAAARAHLLRGRVGRPPQCSAALVVQHPLERLVILPLHVLEDPTGMLDVLLGELPRQAVTTSRGRTDLDQPAPPPARPVISPS